MRRARSGDYRESRNYGGGPRKNTRSVYAVAALGVRTTSGNGIECAFVALPDGQYFFRGVSMFGFYSNQLGCLGSVIVSLIGTAILILVIRSCSG